MPINVPAESKVYTTTYDNFRGVDFTNDATNVWRRRSPSGVNMLPDESGRPFKRHGWNVLLSNSELSAALGVESCVINKCAYFELAGVDHIVVFTDNGVVFYIDSSDVEDEVELNGVAGVTAINTDYDCYSGFDRSFFFEGDGTAAFYIYGNFKVWRYEADFQLHDVTKKVTIPTVMIAADATGAGIVYNSFNLLGSKAYIEYNSIDLWDYWCSDGLSVAVDKTAFTTGKEQGEWYAWEWDANSGEQGAWTILHGGKDFPSDSVEVQGEKKGGDKVVIVWLYGVMLPNNVAESQVDGEVKIWGSKKTQFDWEINCVSQSYTGEAILFSDPIGKRAWIKFPSERPTALADGEDFLRVQFPSVKIDITEYPIENPEPDIRGGAEDCRDNGYAHLIGV